MHLANGVNHARKFVTRILATLRYMTEKDQTWTTISTDFKADVYWFLKYSQQANGITLIKPPLHPVFIESDSSLTGVGGASSTHYYSWVYSHEHREKYAHIHQLEAINLLVAYRTLCPVLNTQGKKIVIITDNLGSAYALTTGRTKDSVLSNCAQEMWLEAAKADHQIEIQHQEGKNIPLADALSRAHSDHRKALLVTQIVQRRGITRLHPKLSE